MGPRESEEQDPSLFISFLGSFEDGVDLSIKIIIPQSCDKIECETAECCHYEWL